MSVFSSEMLPSDINYDIHCGIGQKILQAALSYEARGWSVIPLCDPRHLGYGRDHGRACQSHGKCPVRPWKEFQTKPATEKQIRQWWHESPTSNVGVVLGNVSGMVDIDVDGEAGMEALTKMSGGVLPKTLEFWTPGGGYRYLYAIPTGFRCRTFVDARGVKSEVRFQANGAQTVMPPSLGWRRRDVPGGGKVESIVAYSWADGRSPDSFDIATAPAWLLKAVEDTGERKAWSTGFRIDEDAEVPQGQRDNWLASIGGTLRRRGINEQEIRQCLDILNQSRCNPPLADVDLDRISRSTARYAPDPNLDIDSEERWQSLQDSIRDLYVQPDPQLQTPVEPPAPSPDEERPATVVDKKTPTTKTLATVQPPDKAKHCEELRNAAVFKRVNLPISRVVQLGIGQHSKYVLLLEGGGEVTLGTPSTLSSLSAFKNQILTELGYLPHDLRASEHGPLVNLIAAASEKQPLPVDEDSETTAWLALFLEGAISTFRDRGGPSGDEAMREAHRKLKDYDRHGQWTQTPIILGDRSVILHFSSFSQWLKKVQEVRIPDHGLAFRLHRLGFDDRHPLRHKDDNGKEFKTNVWRSKGKFIDHLDKH